jgi:hypothetical protein
LGRAGPQPRDHAGEPDFWQQLRAKALHLRQTTDKALIIVAGCNLFKWGTFLRRLDNFLMDLLLEPDQVERLLLDLSPEQVVNTLDLSYLEDVLTREQALALLVNQQASRGNREKIIETGIPVMTPQLAGSIIPMPR